MDLNLSIQEAPLYFISLGLSLLTLITGFHVLSHSREKLAKVVSIMFFILSIHLISGAMDSFKSDKSTFVLFFKMSWVLALVGGATIYFATIVYRETIEPRLKVQRRIVYYYIIPVYLGCALLMIFTNFFVGPEPIPFPSNNIKPWIPDVTEYLGIIVTSQAIFALLTSYNCFHMFLKGSSKKYYKRRFFIIFLASVLFAFSLMVLIPILYLADLGFLEKKAILEIAYITLISLSYFIFVISILEYNAFIEEGRKIFRNYLATVVNYVFLFLIYTSALIIIFSLFDKDEIFPILLATLGVLLVITHYYNPAFQKGFIKFMENKRLKMMKISNHDVYFAIKNVNSVSKLSCSKLLGLQCVNIEARHHGVNKEEALSKLIGKVLLENFPHNEGVVRTRSRIKYEILRMIIEEQAVESQILWNLSFDSGSLIKSEKKPLVPLLSNSEYKATSIRSYRRLRKEAINDFKWEIIQVENKALRNWQVFGR